jgi:hypothetical protein
MGMEKRKLTQAVLGLLAQARLGEKEVQSRFEYALSPHYWRALLPGLTVCEPAEDIAAETAMPHTEQMDELLSQLRRGGYFQADDVLSHSWVRRTRECVETLHRADWPPTFAFVYDQFWLATRGPAVTRLLAAALGPGFMQLPNPWAHYVHPGTEGWNPHIDGRYGPGKLSLWIALSDATLDNGCMCLVPKTRVPDRIARGWERLKNVSRAELRALLQGSRALPVRAGSVLGWESGIIHWGLSSLPGAAPRISIALEFIRSGIKRQNPGNPFVDPRAELPSFRQRLNMIGRAILSYEEFEPRMLRYLGLARRLVSSVGATAGRSGVRPRADGGTGVVT